MVEKFDNKDAKKSNFINQMEFRKKSIKKKRRGNSTEAASSMPLYRMKV